MKTHLAVAAALVALAAAGAASAADVEIRHAMARVIVIPEARSDVAYDIRPGRRDLPQINVTRGPDGRLVFDGGVGQSWLTGCNSFSLHGGAGVINVAHPSGSVRVSAGGHRNVALADTPLIILRTPKDVRIAVGDEVFGNIGKADSVQLRTSGCGDWTVDKVSGGLEIDVAGSGDIHAASARALTAHIDGDGDVTAGEVGDLNVSISGSGDVWVRRADGAVRAQISGSGDVAVAGGHASALTVAVGGSGDVHFGGEADRLDARVSGSGDVHVNSVRGEVHKAVAGSGEVIVGR